MTLQVRPFQPAVTARISALLPEDDRRKNAPLNTPKTQLRPLSPVRSALARLTQVNFDTEVHAPFLGFI